MTTWHWLHGFTMSFFAGAFIGMFAPRAGFLFLSALAISLLYLLEHPELWVQP